MQCLKSFEADTTLIILRDFMGDVTADLMSLLSNPPIPLVVVCFGHISAAAFSLLNIGTVVLAHTSTTFTLSCSPLIPTSRTRTHALLPNKCIGAAEALKMGIVDFVGTTDKMDVELQHVLKNLVLASVCKTYGSTTYFLPTSAEAMVLSEGLARMPAQGRAGEEKQLVTLDICRESGVVTVQLNDAKHFNTFSAELGAEMQAAMNYLLESVGICGLVLRRRSSLLGRWQSVRPETIGCIDFDHRCSCLYSV